MHTWELVILVAVFVLGPAVGVFVLVATRPGPVGPEPPPPVMPPHLVVVEVDAGDGYRRIDGITRVVMNPRRTHRHRHRRSADLPQLAPTNVEDTPHIYPDGSRS